MITQQTRQTPTARRMSTAKRYTLSFDEAISVEREAKKCYAKDVFIVPAIRYHWCAKVRVSSSKNQPTNRDEIWFQLYWKAQEEGDKDRIASHRTTTGPGLVLKKIRLRSTRKAIVMFYLYLKFDDSFFFKFIFIAIWRKRSALDNIKIE